jgi:hypothetical protein
VLAGQEEHLFVGRFDDLIGTVPLFFFGKVADIAGMDQETGCVGIALILSIASVSVARGSGLGGRWKPMRLSLICTKVSSPCGASAAAASPIRPGVRGTPPLKVQTTPVPAQVMHFNRPRRLMFGPPSNSF